MPANGTDYCPITTHAGYLHRKYMEYLQLRYDVAEHLYHREHQEYVRNHGLPLTAEYSVFKSQACERLNAGQRSQARPTFCMILMSTDMRDVSHSSINDRRQ